MLYQQQQAVITRPRNIQAKLVLAFGIIQILIGVSVFGSNIFLVNRTGLRFELWAGLWILVGGIIGVFSHRHPTNRTLNGANMVFAIVSSCISFLFIAETALYIHYFLEYQKECKHSGCDETRLLYFTTSGFALSCVILVLMLAELAISVAAAIVCCIFGCAAGCIEDNSNAYTYQQVYQQAPPNMLVQRPPQAQTSSMPEQQEPLLLQQ